MDDQNPPEESIFDKQSKNGVLDADGWPIETRVISVGTKPLRSQEELDRYFMLGQSLLFDF